MMSPHPLDPLQPEEIHKATEIVRNKFPNDHINFRVITLKEPPKSELTVFLAHEHDDDHAINRDVTRPARIAMVHVLITSSTETKARFLDLRIDLDKSSIVHEEHLIGRHSYIDAEYMQAVEKICLADPKVQAQIAELDLPTGVTVIVEPWAYATDGTNDMSERVTMCYFYLRTSDHPDSNHYAYPLDVCAEVSESLMVTQLYRLPSGEHDQINNDTKLFDKQRVHPTSEYYPDFIKARETTKPYQVTQPDGPSFDVVGNHIAWEKWSFRVGFNYREGLTIHDVRFDKRNLFYRISLAEMFVPYGDSRSPYQRKGAFDLGNDGAGINANNLRLGCDCLGHIKYFDGWHNTSNGEPLKLPNVVCCHEIDDGILWKHTNFRTGNPAVARSRVLVLQTVVTVTNYEYVFAFHFKQDASIHYEVRATGILSSAPIDIDDKVSFGTIVAPGVLAPYHQHLFSLRIDPAIDGANNTLMVEETIPMPFDESLKSPINRFGVGFTTRSEAVLHETYLDLDHSRNRVFKVVNESNINPVTKTPVGYQLVPFYSQSLLAHPSSFHAKRAEFAQHAVWVTRYHEDELYPAGTHTMQSAGGEGIASWINNRKLHNSSHSGKTSNGNIHNSTVASLTNGHTNDTSNSSTTRDTDIVIWHTFGSTHIPRIEDWPVMPCEKMGVTLKPVNFFAGNPGLDVAVARQEVNKSVLVEDDANGSHGTCKRNAM